MSDPLFSREPSKCGFSIVPHGLWTADLSKGAIVLLGWLQSHSDSFLASLTLNNCREALATSSTGAWFKELEKAGFVRVTPAKIGQRASICLLAEPWDALNGRESRNRPTDRAETGAPKPAYQPRRNRRANRAETGAHRRTGRRSSENHFTFG